ncbi:MAG: secondary thiamine-phosphate synthase enzyme YjbQ [bacterium]|jgi:secondary thiamine-phosphate synthase enzyme|nr:secondary thiamine-phosphate synthase enzyme YjbQ [bacterium]
MLSKYSLRTTSKEKFIDITGEVQQTVFKSGIRDGICVVYVPHTTAGVTINENVDPTVRSDILEGLQRMVPNSGNYQHLEGNSPAHIKASLIGVSIQVPVASGKLKLGQWQGIFFSEFDGPRTREYLVKVL